MRVAKVVLAIAALQLLRAWVAAAAPIAETTELRMLSAYRSGDSAAVRRDWKADPAARDSASLNESMGRAVVNGHEDAVRMWLMLGANPNDIDNLCFAANRGMEGIARILVDHGADVNAADELGGTGLIHASIHGHVGIMKLLLDHGAQVDTPDINGVSPLHFAAEAGDTAVAALLLRHRANLEARTADGNTPLMIAVSGGKTAMAEFLLDHGANIDAYGPKGTVFDVASTMDALRTLVRAIVVAPPAVSAGRFEWKDIVPYVRSAASAGGVSAQYFMGKLCSQGVGTRKDRAEAARWYRKAAEQGHAVAQHCLGVAYQEGVGVSASEKEAVIWYRKAAEQGYAPSQSNLAEAYTLGAGVNQDYASALQWYSKAAAQGLPQGRTGVATLYWEGKGVPRDTVYAVKWFRMAAEQGYAPAEWRLAIAYMDGDAPDACEQALAWLRKAAAQGDVNAIFSIGLNFEIGRCVSTDSVLACAWYHLAATRGDKDGEQRRDALATKMTAKQLKDSMVAIAEICKQMPPACGD